MTPRAAYDAVYQIRERAVVDGDADAQELLDRLDDIAGWSTGLLEQLHADAFAPPTPHLTL
jgi:hypothetical protein